MVRPPRFDAHWQRRRRRVAWWRAWRWWLALVLVLAAGWGLSRLTETSGAWEEVDTAFTLCGERRSHGCVIDGDTIMLGDRRIRLAGFDAPELDGVCAAERQLALQARAALRDWLNRGPFLLDGGTDPPRDRFGRELRAARRNDAVGQRMLAATMREAGFARAAGGPGSKGWCE